MSKKRVHLLSVVNARNVAKDGATYTIRDVCGAVDGIVMNGMLYPGDQLAAGAPTLEGKPAPAGHPKNAAGQYISAVNGEALAAAWIGSYASNARHEGGRTLVDIRVNAAQAKASDAGAKLIERLDAALAGTNVEPIHVSTGLLCETVEASGESRGKPYARIATNIRYDHLAILLNEHGAGTPDEGVGMWLNAAGQAEAVEVADATGAQVTDDRRSAGLKAWVMKLLGNRVELSFDQIRDGLYRGLQEACWVVEVYDRYAIWSDRDGKLYRQDYTVASDGSVAWAGTAVEVRRETEYVTVTNLRKEDDPMKDKILAALNAAGIKTDGLDESGLLAAYNALVAQPIEAKLTAANGKIAEAEAAARAAEEAEVKALATELATNSALTVDDLAKLGKARLQELKAKAAPVLPAGGGQGGAKDVYEGYSLNSFIDIKQAA